MRGRSSPTSAAFDGAVTPPVLFLVVFLIFLLFLPLPEKTYSHTVTRENLGPFCRDSVHFHRRDTQQLYGSAGGGLRGVRGSPSQGTPSPPTPLFPFSPTPPPLAQLCTVLQITDKLWQMGSGKWVLHSRDTSNYTGAPLASSAPCVPWEGSYQCEEVTEGNANLTWGACTLPFILYSDKGFAAASRGGPVCLITMPCGTMDGVLQDLCCAFCWVQDQITGLREKEQYRAQSMEAAGSGWACKAWEMCSWIDRPFYSGQETQICRCWTAGTHQNYSMGNKYSWNIVYSSHCWVFTSNSL